MGKVKPNFLPSQGRTPEKKPPNKSGLENPGPGKAQTWVQNNGKIQPASKKVGRPRTGKTIM